MSDRVRSCSNTFLSYTALQLRAFAHDTQWRNDGVAAASSDGGPTGGRGPPTVLEFLVINFRGPDLRKRRGAPDGCVTPLSILSLLGGSVVGSRVVGVLDSGAAGPGFKSQPRGCRVTVLGKLFTPIVPLFTKQQNW